MSALTVAAPEIGTGLEEAFRKYRNSIFRTAYRVTGSASDAEDVLQTVFLRLSKQKNGGGDIANLSSYLYRSALNAALDVLRSRQSNATQPFEEATAPHARTHDQDLRAQLRGAIAKLNPRHAEMFVLRYVEEYSNGEIAKMLNTSQAVIAVTLFRVRKQLQKDFKS